jgi:hypothetical protein
VYFSAPCLLVNDDSAAAVEYLLDVDAQCFAVLRPVAPQRMNNIRICGLMASELARWFITSFVKHGRRCCLLFTFGITSLIFLQLRGWVSMPSSSTQDEKTIRTLGSNWKWS